jgi:hypothetical protein
LAFLLILLYPQLTLGAEHVIFEQIGQLAGSTSYLHAHITVSVSSIDEQLLAYEKLLRTDYTDYKKVYGGKVRPSRVYHRNFTIAVLSSQYYHRSFIIAILPSQFYHRSQFCHCLKLNYLK